MSAVLSQLPVLMGCADADDGMMVMIEALRKVIKRMHYPLEVMLTRVRWYAAYSLSLRHIEEIVGPAKPISVPTE